MPLTKISRDMVASGARASTADVQAETSVDTFISPATLKDSKRVAKAWVNFNGAGTVSIISSFNVSSITDNGIGDYTVNYTTAMTDANYAIVSGTRGPNDGANVRSIITTLVGTPPATTSVRVQSVRSDTSALIDTNNIYLGILSN